MARASASELAPDPGASADIQVPRTARRRTGTAARRPASALTQAELARLLPRNRHRTAISRIDCSRPLRTALDDDLIPPDATFLDYGCGLGDDVRHLRLQGLDARGWDPFHRPDGDLTTPARVVNLGYVVNVIEDENERVECLRRAWSCAERLLIVSARLVSEAPDLTPVGDYADGFFTSIPTFQKLYEQAELRDWIELTLNATAVAAAPGVFYVFRDDEDRIGFLARRHQRRRPHAVPAAARARQSLEQYRELLRPLLDFFAERGRAPAEDELGAEGERIREQFGSVRRAFRIVERGHDAEAWASTVTARGQDLLLFLALSRFSTRPRFGRLPRELRLDVRAFFPNYKNACTQADAALVATGDLRRIRAAALRSDTGKLTPSAIYVHTSALDRLPPLLRLYEGCAQGYIGRVEGANLIKLHTGEPKVSYLSYPEFDADPHPALAHSLTVHLQTFRVREREYREARNPPILHRKETFIAGDHPLHAKFARLTRQEEARGLYEDTARIGTRQGWEEALAARGVTLRGHRVVRAH